MTGDPGSAAQSADVVVVGGGLAGISAAIDLAEAGLAVTLIEARPWLGGATCSFGRRGLTIDNGQHVFLRCCTAYRDLLARLGVTGSCVLQDRLDVTVLDATRPGRQSRVRRSRLPAPLHLAGALAGYRLLTVPDRLRVGAAAAALQFADTGLAAGQDVSLGDWLGRRGQSTGTRQMFWDLLSAAGLNALPDGADLGLAAAALRMALFAGRDHADLGVPSVPLGSLHSAPAAALLSRLGVTIRLGARVAAIEPGPAGGYYVRLAQVTGDGHLAPADAEQVGAAGVVLAVPASEAAALAPPGLAGQAARWSLLRSTPVISLHVVYSRRVTRLPFAAVAGAPVRWVADKTEAAGLHGGQYLAASVPAADGYVDRPAGQLRAELLPVLERVFPAAAHTSVEDFFVTRERRATITPVPGSQRLRETGAGSPGAEGLPGLAVAGAWTDTGWPDTMEGAVRSGRSAAAALMAGLGAGSGRPAEEPAAVFQASTAGTPG